MAKSNSSDDTNITLHKHDELYYEDELCARKFSDNNWSDDLKSNLKLYLKSKELCDIVLIVDNAKLYCHRVILASISPFFAAMFRTNMNEKDKREIVLENYDQEVMKLVIKYIYTGSTVIDQKNVYQMFQAADFFQISGLCKLCVTYMKQIVSITNCIEMFQFAHIYKNDELMAEAGHYFLSIVSQAPNQEEFLLLPIDIVCDLLNICHKSCGRPKPLTLPSSELEIIIFNACVAWLNYRLYRNILADKIFQSVSFVLLPEEFFRETVLKEKLVVNCCKVMEHATKVLQFFQSPMRRSEVDIDYFLHVRKGRDNCENFNLCGQIPLGTMKGIILLFKLKNCCRLVVHNDELKLENAIADGGPYGHSLCLTPSLMSGKFMFFPQDNAYKLNC